MEKKERSFLQSLILALLVILMLTQCTIYINLVENIDNSRLPVFPESMLALLSDQNSSTTASVHNILLPYFCAASKDGSRYAYRYNNADNEKIWQSFIEVLKNCPGGTTKKVLYSDDGKKYEYLDELYRNSDNYFYVKLRNGIELSVLCSIISQSSEIVLDNAGFEVSDMFLFYGGSGEAYITAVSGDGEVLKIFPSRNITFNKELLSTYTDTERNDYEFIKVNKNIEGKRNCYFPVFRHSVVIPDIVRLDYSEFEKSLEGTNIFARIFGMNEDNIKTYSTINGDTVYVQDATSLTVSHNGTVEFQPEYGETTLSDFLNPGNSTKNTFGDIIKASFEISAEINKMLNSCAGKLVLSDIVYSDGTFRLYYDYTICGIPVNNGDKYGLYLEFSDSVLVYGSVNIRPYVYSEGSGSDIPQKSAYALLVNEIKTPVSYFGAEYRVLKNTFDTETGSMLWTVKTDREEAE